MAQRPTITDVALEAGVSVSTVSKAVNGRYGISTATADRVMQVVERLGYESSLVASSMRSRRTGVIGILVADFEPFSTEILKGVGTELHESGFDLLAYSGAQGAGWERRSLSRLSGTLIDAAILVTPTVVDVNVDIPVVAIDPHSGPGHIPTVEGDSLGGAVIGTRHLIELGHRRIAFVSGRSDLRSSTLREAGYRHALAEAGIPFDPELVRVGSYEQQAARDSARSLLSGAGRPTAVFAANDLSAIGIMDVAREVGLEVPGDLSVIGFDDIPEATRTSPPLTTVRQPIQALGRTAASMLLTLMGGHALDQTHVKLPTRLVARASTAGIVGGGDAQ